MYLNLTLTDYSENQDLLVQNSIITLVVTRNFLLSRLIYPWVQDRGQTGVLFLQ